MNSPQANSQLQFQATPMVFQGEDKAATVQRNESFGNENKPNLSTSVGFLQQKERDMLDDWAGKVMADKSIVSSSFIH